MRICYVGNFTRPWCTEVHVAASLEYLGHDVVRYQENLVDWNTLAERVGGDDGEALLWTRTWHTPEQPALRELGKLRAAGLPTASYHLDRFLGLEREALVDSEPFFRTDVLFCPDAGDWAAHGVNAVWCPPGVFHAEAGARYYVRPQRWPYDVVLVGSYPYPHPEWAPYREEAVRRLRATFGRRFAVIPHDLRNRGAVRGALLGELYATVPVVVGDSCLAGDPPPSRYWSDRIPETVGRGGLLIHPEVGGLADWYSHDEHLLTYPLGDFDSMVALAELALENPDRAREVRRAGRELVLARDTYVHRMRVVADWLQVAATVHAGAGDVWNIHAGFGPAVPPVAV